MPGAESVIGYPRHIRVIPPDWYDRLVGSHPRDRLTKSIFNTAGSLPMALVMLAHYFLEIDLFAPLYPANYCGRRFAAAVIYPVNSILVLQKSNILASLIFYLAAIGMTFNPGSGNHLD